MIHLILTILKIIGIVIGILLSILLLLFLLVLFVPFRYQAKGHYRGKEDYCVYVHGSWLLRLIIFRLIYEAGVLKPKLNILGIPVSLHKKEKRQTLKKEQKKGKQPLNDISAERKEHSEGSEEIDVRNTEDSVLKKDMDSENTIEEKKISIKRGTTGTDTGLKGSRVKKAANSEAEVLDERSSDNERTSVDSNAHVQEMEEDDKDFFTRFLNKIRAFFAGIKHFFIRLKEIFNNTGYAWKNFCDKIKKVAGKIERAVDFLQDNENHEAFQLIWNETKHLIKHIKPVKFKVKARIGFADPYMTGQVLAVMGMFYPVYQDSIELMADFEEEVLEGEFFLKGRIRVFSLLVMAVKILKNTQIRSWIFRK